MREFGRTFQNPIAGSAIGKKNRKRGKRCTATGGGFVASTEKNCCGGAGICWNAASRMPMRPAACGACSCGRENILKRLLIHLGGFNLSLVMQIGRASGRGRG